jgi:small GTP-binding protein
MSSPSNSFSNKQCLLEDEETFDLDVLKQSNSPSSTFRDLVSNTCHNNIKTRVFPLPSTNIRSRLPSICYGKDGSSSIDEYSTESSSSTSDNSELSLPKSNYRIMILGAKKVGKTSIVRQFLYDKFSDGYKETVDDMYRGEFDIYGKTVGFDIQDVSGQYVYEFPGMRTVSLASTDAFILVFSFDSFESWEEVRQLRDMIQADKGEEVPIVIVGNKSDVTTSLDERIPFESLEATVVFDWENGYVECSAKERFNINKIFKELLQQAKTKYDFDGPPSTPSYTNTQTQSNAFRGCNFSNPTTIRNSTSPGILSQNGKTSCPKSRGNDVLKRRQSLPVVCPVNVMSKIAEKTEVNGAGSFGSTGSRKRGTLINGSLMKHLNISGANGMSESEKPDGIKSGKSPVNRRASMAALRKDSCKVQ